MNKGIKEIIRKEPKRNGIFEFGKYERRPSLKKSLNELNNVI